MNVLGIAWLGTRTSKFDAMLHLYQIAMGMKVVQHEPGFVVLDLPNGDKVELFGDESAYGREFTHPVAGFLVDDIESARAELQAAGVEFFGPIERTEDGYAWSHFRAPDGFLYELTYAPEHQLLKK